MVDLANQHPMVWFSVGFDALAGHGRAENFKTESDIFGSNSKNSKKPVILSTNKATKFYCLQQGTSKKVSKKILPPLNSLNNSNFQGASRGPMTRATWA